MPSYRHHPPHVEAQLAELRADRDDAQRLHAAWDAVLRRRNRRIRKLRREGVTLRELALAAGVTDSRISDLANPTPRRRKKKPTA
jgi:hypothetical protein